MPNKKTINTKNVKIKQILDSYKLDSLRRLGIDVETKDSSLANDTDIAMVKVAALANDHLEKYLGLFDISTIPDGIKINSKNFRWDKIGLGLSSSFEILSGNNAGVYTISKIESTILTLSSIGLANISESKIISIRYSLAGVLLVSETTQGFADIQGVISPETYTNLFYSKFRNIQKWLPYLATCSMRFMNSSLKISFLKSNQDLSTRLNTEIVSLVEKNDITVASISELKCITDRTFKVNIYLNDPTNITDIFTELNTRNVDGTIGGYYEFLDNNKNIVKGYPEKLEFIPLENKIEAICLEKYELGNGFIDVITANRRLYLQYSAFGVYVTIYKVDGTLFCKEKRFNKIMINGITYTDLNTFINDLEYYFSL